MLKKIAINAFLMGKEPQVTTEIIEYYRENPEELDLIEVLIKK